MDYMGWWLKQKVHVSWLVALVSAGFVAGVTLALAFRVPWWLGVVTVIFVVFGFWLRTVYILPLLLISSLVSGLGYGSAHLGARDVYRQFIGQIITVQGRVKEDPSRSASGSLSLQLDRVEVSGQKTLGFIYVNVRGSPDVKRGDVVMARGVSQEGFGNFPISLSVPKLESVTRPVPGDVGRVVRDWFGDKVRELIPEPEASLGLGFLTGQKSALPDDLSNAMKIAGLTHIVVASGYNLTILVRMARRLFIKLSKYLSAVSAGAMITMFMAVTGLSPSMTRAGLVSGLSLMAWYYGHRLHPFVLLPFAAAITVAINPNYAWGDIGWQLSFAAFAGVMTVGPLIQNYFFGSKEPGIIRQILGETIAAHLVTIPIIALSFGTVSNVAIIANILVVPLVPLAMLLTFICGMWAIIALPFGWLVALPITWLLGYMINVATFVSELSWAQFTVSLPTWLWIGYGAVLIGACFMMWRATKYDFGGANIVS